MWQKSQRKHRKKRPKKKHKLQTNVNLDDLGTGKSDNFLVQQKFSPIDKFRNESIIESLYCIILILYWILILTLFTQCQSIIGSWKKRRKLVQVQWESCSNWAVSFQFIDYRLQILDYRL